MALRSMTGFGRGKASSSGMKIEVDLSSVNRRQFDVRMNLPRMLAALESRACALIRKDVSRGWVTGTVKIGARGNATDERISVDTNKVRTYIKVIRKAAAELKLKDDMTARSLVYLPDVIQCKSILDDSEEAWRLVKRALKEAVGKLVEMRTTEGRALEKDLVRRLARLKRRLDQIKRSAPKLVLKYRRLLEKRLRMMGVRFGPQDQQLARELALFADRSDISEEIVRLDSHFNQFHMLRKSCDSVGRRLDFLCQEMLREINTIGAKASDAAISAHVIRFKADLESVREQVQNVE